MDETQYLNLLQKILEKGDEKSDRTGTGTLSCFGNMMEFDISKSIPLLTTKKVFVQSIIKELLWFISGTSSTLPLKEQGVNFWNENTSREFLNNIGLKHFSVGELGVGYGFNWRHYGATYDGPGDYSGQGVDQLQNVIDDLKTNPSSRRLIVNAWNPAELDNVALPPCHMIFQFNSVKIDGQRYLDCMMIQRSGDMFLGIPFNIASYSILTYMIAHLTDMKPRKFVHVIGDAHIYKNHVEQVKLQLDRSTFPFPILTFARDVKNIDDFKLEDFKIENYRCHPYIPGKMAV